MDFLASAPLNGLYPRLGCDGHTYNRCRQGILTGKGPMQNITGAAGAPGPRSKHYPTNRFALITSGTVLVLAPLAPIRKAAANAATIKTMLFLSIAFPFQFGLLIIHLSLYLPTASIFLGRLGAISDHQTAGDEGDDPKLQKEFRNIKF